MNNQEKTIVINYNARLGSKVLNWLGLSFLVMMFIVGLLVGLFIDYNWKESFQNAFLYAGIMFPVSLVLWLIAFFQRMKQDKGYFICISPEGITDAKGRFISIEEIEHCHLVYHSSTSVSNKNSMAFVTLEYLLIQLKSGKQKKIRMSNYELPDFMNYYDRINEILGVSLFTEKETVHVKRVDC